MLNSSTLLPLSGLLALASPVWGQTPTFAPFVTYKTGTNPCYPSGIAVSDVNGDGKPDIITANTFNDAIGVLLGNGNGTFQAARSYYTGTVPYPDGYSHQPVRVAIADINGDRKPDAVVINSQSNSVGVLPGNGDGTFQNPTTYLLGTGSLSIKGLAVADINADGRPDVLTANYSVNTMSVLLASSTGSGLQPAVSYSTGGASNPRNITIADVNNDGKPDALTANSKSSTIGALLGNGDGTFGTVATSPTDNGVGNTSGLATGDLDGDGKQDVLVLDEFNVDALRGNGNGTFQAAKRYLADPMNGSAGPVDVAAADLNGDGRLDAVTANFNFNTVGVLQGVGTGTFKQALSFGVGTLAQPVGVAVADVNGDGKPDLLTINKNTSNVSVLLNTTAYTPLVSRATLLGASATLAPNPANTYATLSLAGLPATVAQVHTILLDATGRTVGQQAMAVAGGSVSTELSTAALAPGLYVVRLLALDARGEATGTLPTQRLSIE